MDQSYDEYLKAGNPICGYVKDGKVIPNGPLPEGTWVHIRLITERIEFTPEERAEFEAWNRLSDGALINFERMVTEEEQPDAQG
jgi:hypothetical protein